MTAHIALSGREDVSRFMVHLTRNNKRDHDDGGTARENLRSILSEQRIRAISSHCTFNRKVTKLPEKTRRRFNTACFTETPLNQIHLLVQDIPGRSIKLSSYGICFRKDFIVSKGGQPALYINEYDGTWLRECVDEGREPDRDAPHEMPRAVSAGEKVRHDSPRYWPFCWTFR